MKKIIILLVVLAFFLFLFSLLPSGEAPPRELSELESLACNTADQAGTCNTRLSEIGIVLREDCCKSLGKCC